MGNVDELIQQYKQEAEQFSLTPAPHVWENVDREINGGKRKKRFFIILFLLGCGLAYGLLTANLNIWKKTATSHVPATDHNTIAAQPDAPGKQRSGSNTSQPEYQKTVSPQQLNKPAQPEGVRQAALKNKRPASNSTIPATHLTDRKAQTKLQAGLTLRNKQITALRIKRLAAAGNKRLSLNKKTLALAQPVTILQPDEGSFTTKQPVQKIKAQRMAVSPRKRLTVNSRAAVIALAVPIIITPDTNSFVAKPPVQKSGMRPMAAIAVRRLTISSRSLVAAPVVAVTEPDTNSFIAKQPIQNIKTLHIARLQASSRKRLVVNGQPMIPAQPIAIMQPDTNNFTAKTMIDKKQQTQKIAAPRIPRLSAVARQLLTINAHASASPTAVPVMQPDTNSFVAKTAKDQNVVKQFAISYITHIPASGRQMLPAGFRPAMPQYVNATAFTPYITDTIPEPFIPLPPEYEEGGLGPAPEYIAPMPALAGQARSTPVTFPAIQLALLEEPTLSFRGDTLEAREDIKQEGKEDTALKVYKRRARKYRWAVSLDIASASNNRTITEPGDYQFIKHYRDSTDKRLTSFNYAASLHYNISERLRLDVGVGINKAGERINTRQVVYKTDSFAIIPTGHIVVLSAPTIVTVAGRKYYNINNDSTGHINNSLTYLSLSGGFTYFMQPGKKFRIGLQPAFAASKLFASNEYYYHAKDSTYRKARGSQLSSWMLSATMGVPFEYSFKPRFIVSVTPYYTAFLNPVYASKETITQQYKQSGVKVGLSWMFR